MEQLLVSGVTVGCIYALIALSFTPAFACSNIVNFAQGELMMLGAMVAVTFVGILAWPYPLAMIPVMAIVAVVSLVIYLAVVRVIRSRGGKLFSMVLGTMAAGILVQVAASFYWGLDARRVPAPLGYDAVVIGEFLIPPQAFVIVGATIVALAVVWYLHNRTIFGLAMRATACNSDGAKLMGIDVEWLTAASFLLSGAMAGFAGILYGPLVNASPWAGLQYALWGFTALIVGGLGSWSGPVAAGIALGLIEAFGKGYLGSAYGDAIRVAILLAFLYVRPTGLFGSPDTIAHA